MSSQVAGQECVIRGASATDASTIAEVLHEAFVEYLSLYTPEGFAATTPPPDQILDRFDEGPIWVALQGDVIVGTVSVVPKGEGLYVRGMAVLPTARGQGVGNQLLKQVESYAHEIGATHMYLSTTPFLTRAIQLYEHYGFRRNDEGPHDLSGTPLFTMVKRLT